MAVSVRLSRIETGRAAPSPTLPRMAGEGVTGTAPGPGGSSLSRVAGEGGARAQRGRVGARPTVPRMLHESRTRDADR
jgi:hypothetical protein